MQARISWCHKGIYLNTMGPIDDVTLEQLKLFTTTGMASQLAACFEVFWQSTAAELLWFAIKFQSFSQPFKMQRLQFTFEVPPL